MSQAQFAFDLGDYPAARELLNDLEFEVIDIKHARVWCRRIDYMREAIDQIEDVRKFELCA
jgi:hypothetical protein